MTEVSIQLDPVGLNFVLVNCADQLVANKRLAIGLRRLRYNVEENSVLVPYEEQTKISTLTQIQRLLSKHGTESSLSTETQNVVASFHREQQLFDEFAGKAFSIRNDNFNSQPELVAEFDKFKSVLEKNLVRTLYPRQTLASFHMAFAQNSCNFAVPGAGKTSIVYGAYAYLRQLAEDDPRRVDKLLVVGPLSSFSPWETEYFECFGSHPCSQRLSGDASMSKQSKEQHLYSGNPAELTLIFHGGVSSLQAEIVDFLKSNRTMVVIDEAHRIKNPDGVWGQSAVEIAKEARARVVLTGTPVPNGYEDLYNLYQFIYPYKFDSILGFNYASLCELSESDSIVGNPIVERLIENIGPFFIRIKKNDLALPPRTETLVEVEMGFRQREIYDFIESTYIRSFRKNPKATVKDILNRAKLIRLRQAATNPELLARPLEDALNNSPEFGEVDPNTQFVGMSDEFVDDSEFFHYIRTYSSHETPQKFVEVLKILQEKIESASDKFIVWTIFIQNSKSLQKYLAENSYPSRLLIGEIDQKERESIISQFNDPADSEFQVVIANPFAVSESISLHKGCHNAIYLERDYNCASFIQSMDRIHRVGLPRDVITNYYYIVAKDSIDIVIDKRLQFKKQRMEAIIDEEIPLFNRIDNNDETDVINGLLEDYARRAL